MFLGNHHSKSIARCIGVHNKRFQPIRGFQYWFTCTHLFQSLEGLLIFLWPVPLAILAGEIIQWACNIGEVRDEGSVEITEAEEAVNILDAGGGWPLGDPLNLDWIHPNFAVAYDHA